jgi:hypothetical protein
MYYLFRINWTHEEINPESYYLTRRTENIIFAFYANNKHKLFNKIKKTHSFTEYLGDLFNFSRFFGYNTKLFGKISFPNKGEKIELMEEERLIERRSLFRELYKKHGNKIFEEIYILEELECKKEIISHVSFMNKLQDTKYTIQWIESPLYNMLQFFNQKEINPVVHDFVNHSLFDRNVLGLINEY